MIDEIKAKEIIENHSGKKVKKIELVKVTKNGDKYFGCIVGDKRTTACIDEEGRLLYVPQ